MKMKERNTQPTRDNSPEIFLRSKEGDQGGNGPLLGSQQIRNWVQKKGTLQCIFAWSWQVRGLYKALLPNELHIFTWLSLSLHVLDHGFGETGHLKSLAYSLSPPGRVGWLDHSEAALASLVFSCPLFSNSLSCSHFYTLDLPSPSFFSPVRSTIWGL